MLTFTTLNTEGYTDQEMTLIAEEFARRTSHFPADAADGADRDYWIEQAKTIGEQVLRDYDSGLVS